MSTANRKYKDSVFVDLFSEDEKAKENFLSLYNALHNTELTDIEQLKNIRLEQVLYMTFYNDVSYLVDNKIIVLAEHQATINPGIPHYNDCNTLWRQSSRLLHRCCLWRNAITLSRRDGTAYCNAEFAHNRHGWRPHKTTTRFHKIIFL